LTQVGALGAVATFASGCAADPAVDASRAADAADTSATLAMPEAGALQEAEYAEQDQRAADEAAVRRTVERYFALAVASTKSREALEARRRLTSPTCEQCSQALRVAASLRRDGVSVVGGKQSVRIRDIAIERDDAVVESTEVNQAYALLDRATGQRVGGQEGFRSRSTIMLKRQPPGNWLISDFEWSTVP